MMQGGEIGPLWCKIKEKLYQNRSFEWYNVPMKRKLFCLLLVALFSCLSVFASGFHFVFGDAVQHPEIVWGFLPAYINAGLGYDGFSLMSENTTDIQFLAGAGFSQRKLWQNPVDGSVIRENPLIYDVWDFDWSVRFLQGFWNNPLNESKDLVTITLAYNGQFEMAKDSIASGKTRDNGGENPVLTMDQFFAGANRVDNNIYPEINGDGKFLGTQLATYIKINAMEDTIHENNGFIGKLNLLWGPKALNSSLDGFSDYFSLRADAIGAYTLYNYENGGKSWFSIVLADRMNFSFVTGDAIPAFIQGPESLGRKVRGFNTYTYNTKYTVVNNLDLRLAGPDMGVKGLAARVNLFFDMGYGWGELNNTSIEQSNFICSTGVQGTICFFDFIDLGYQIAYLISGEKYSSGSDKFVGSFTFFLDF